MTSTITKVLCSPLCSECFILLVLASMYRSTHKSVGTVSYLVPTQERSESPNLCLSLVFIPSEKVLKQSWTLTLLALFLSLCLIMMFHHFLFLFPVSNIYSFFAFKFISFANFHAFCPCLDLASAWKIVQYNYLG